ncbi:cell wall metabolism sensor histidine kinase WalK [Arthrobacter alpinus]|uniref:sensor histidine kinase n=1 Tax=Arthrobacter alpinus TaxID=656366 RepID=UPI001644CA53|nr:HAMP domain-containing sensor histidine kinase [Arthrobacter alpinus]
MRRNGRLGSSQEAGIPRWRLGTTGEFFQLRQNRRVLFSQLPLTVTSLLLVALLAMIDPGLIADREVLLGITFVVVLTAVAALSPWEKLPHWAPWTVPLLDFVAIAFLLHGAAASLNGLAFLTVFPVLWLAWSDIPATATRIIAFVAPLCIVWAPFILGSAAPSRAGMIKPLLVPLILLGLATAATVVTRSLNLQARRLAESGAVSRRRARQLDTILNAASAGVVVVDEHGHDVLMNKHQQAIHTLATPAGAVDPDEAGLLVFGPDKVTPVDVGSRPVRRAVKGEEYSGELFWLGDGVHQQAMATSARQIVDDDGSRQGAVIVFHNVTEVMLAMEAQESFVSNVSHELRTPLTSIVGYLELAMEESVDGSVRRYLQVASRNADRLLTLVDDLLRSASGGMNIAAVAGNLAAVVEAGVAAAQPLAHNLDINLRCSAEPELWGTFDPVRMGQALDNLVSNALKYSVHGNVVDVHGFRDGGDLVVEVADAGLGMSQGEQARLFTRFYRTGEARSSSIPGVGLGLSITKAIVEGHGGTISVASKLGVGSTFTLRIPAGDDRR